MENTLENKARFFAQYYGQKIQVDNELEEMGKFPLTINNISFQPEKCHLELTPLPDITDEDAWNVGIMVNCWAKWERKQDWFLSKEDDFHEVHIEGGKSFAEAIGKEWGHGMSHPFANNSTDILSAYDFLRSKGYALPWMGLSVEKLIEYGWIKLKTK